MAEHIHNVFDTDTHFMIDPVTRAITNTSGKSVLVQGDHASERFTFALPKVIDGHDMSQCNKVRVIFSNIGAKEGELSQDVYEVTDLTPPGSTGDRVTCSWLIEKPATMYAGKLHFSLEFRCLDAAGNIAYEWNTDTNKELTVLSKNSPVAAVIEKYPDALAQFEAFLASGGVGALGGVIVSTPSYPWAVVDKDGRVALALDKDYKVVGNGLDKVQAPLKQNGNYDAEINMFICYGQSWSTGYDASAITTVPRYDNLMLDTGIMTDPLSDLTAVATSFLPAVEKTQTTGQKKGETPVTAQMHIVKQLMESEDGLGVADLSYQLLGTAPGMGSKTLAQLEKGTDYYARLIAQVQQAHDIATAMGKRLVVQAFSWVQGSLGRTGNYAEALEQLRADIDADVKAITGQTQDVKCITWQSFIYNASLRAKQVYNQYVGAAETYPNIICAGATYHLDNVSAANLHFTSESQDWLGAYFGVAYKRAIIDGEGFEPVKPTKASKSGKILYVKFNVPQRPLVFDTERLTEAPNKGFKLYATDGTEKTITDVAIISPDTVKIVCDEDVASTDRLTYGEITADAYQWVSDNHGNLRDSQGDHIQYESGAGVSLPINNWCVIFDKTIAEMEG